MVSMEDGTNSYFAGLSAIICRMEFGRGLKRLPAARFMLATPNADAARAMGAAGRGCRRPRGFSDPGDPDFGEQHGIDPARCKQKNGPEWAVR
jgi:hypothetical protein